MCLIYQMEVPGSLYKNAHLWEIIQSFQPKLSTVRISLLKDQNLWVMFYCEPSHIQMLTMVLFDYPSMY